MIFILVVIIDGLSVGDEEEEVIILIMMMVMGNGGSVVGVGGLLVWVFVGVVFGVVVFV